MSDLASAMVDAMLAGATIPLGGLVACLEHIQPRWLEAELRHSVIAFGGGVLVAAIGLVLVPEGMARLQAIPALAAFGAGGIAFFLIDRAIERGGNTGAQLMAMLLDFVPESMAMGAMFATEPTTGLLLAFMIALQNFPEGFTAFRELQATWQTRAWKLVLGFAALVPLGPLAAWLGMARLSHLPGVLGGIMLASAGGILYLTFADIAPQAKLERHWAPPLGAVAGFMLGLAGHAVVA